MTTSLDRLRRVLERPLPEVPTLPSLADEVAATRSYLGSDAAFASIERDPYWPKWDSPWWHALALHESGEPVPRDAAAALANRLSRYPTHDFHLRIEDLPPGVDPYRDAACHCALGCLVPVLLGAGIDVDAELPWIREWFSRWQMADGGMNCDGAAYLAKDEIPSSMVATVPMLEAGLALHTVRPTHEMATFMARAADFLVGRRLVLGSDTRQNAEERESALRWGQLTFPRFYFYDVLRGLSALTRWAEAMGGHFPASAVVKVVEGIERDFPDGVVRVQRQEFADKRSLLPGATGDFERQPDGRWAGGPATRFALLDAAARTDVPSAALTRQWRQTRARLGRLAEAGAVREG